MKNLTPVVSTMLEMSRIYGGKRDSHTRAGLFGDFRFNICECTRADLDQKFLPGK